MENWKNVIVYTDGGARGNPGPAAIGVVVEGEGAKKKYGEYLGEKTNNEAEYSAVVFAMKKLKLLLGGANAKKAKVEFRTDSELMERQLNGEYKIKDPEIKDLFFEIWNLKTDFGQVVFKHIPREENSEADEIVNEVLDKQESAATLDL